MTTLILIAAAVIGLGLLLGLASSPQTKLFRRVWSTERMGGTFAAEKQSEALDQLINRYGIKAHPDAQHMRQATVGLLADAAAFDLKNPNNLGVEIAPVVARGLRLRFPNIAD